MAKVIGLDFGNWNSFPSVVVNNNDLEKNRIGGTVADLLPSDNSVGIPSVFFYSGSIRNAATPLPWVCEDAVRQAARPVENRVRFLKRHLGEKMVLDGQEFAYDDAITQVIQHVFRSANKVLKEQTLEETNLISLSHPATYTPAQVNHLIKLAERATLEDGTHLKVFGVIAEPAAAALDYLSEKAKDVKESTVLVYDLGGGTFDVALVTAWPDGKVVNGKKMYYHVINSRGDNVGGGEFDEVMKQLIREKAPAGTTAGTLRQLCNQAEAVKRDLSTHEEATASIFDTAIDDYVYVTVTRKEFEDRTKALVQRTIQVTREFLNDHPNQKPEMILLTGGSSQMPMIMNAVLAAFPNYSDRTHCYRPTRAISYGAARFGVINKSVLRHTIYQLGVRLYRDTEDKGGFIKQMLPAGSQIPVQSEENTFYTLYEGQKAMKIEVYEAKNQNPAERAIDTDYTYIMNVLLDFGKAVPKNTPVSVQMHIEESGILEIRATDPNNPSNTSAVKTEQELPNLN